jgi:hypothetical protein
VLNAAKPPVWRAWLLLALACWACIAPGVALALPSASAPGFTMRGTETRVGVFCGNYGPARPVKSSQVAELHQGKPAHGYETASGVHVYLYANGNPVRFVDQSGHVGSIAELGAASVDSAILGAMAIPRISWALTIVVNYFIFDAIIGSASSHEIGTRKQELIEADLRDEGLTSSALIKRMNKGNPPIFLDPISLWGDVAEHDGFVQAVFPQWQVLHVGPRGAGAEEFGELNTDEAMRAFGQPSNSQYDRHEYPYKSTLEGGAKAITTFADKSKNRSQGNALKTFYAVNRLRVGDPFIVLVLP